MGPPRSRNIRRFARPATADDRRRRAAAILSNVGTRRTALRLIERRLRKRTTLYAVRSPPNGVTYTALVPIQLKLSYNYARPAPRSALGYRQRFRKWSPKIDRLAFGTGLWFLDDVPIRKGIPPKKPSSKASAPPSNPHGIECGGGNAAACFANSRKASTSGFC